MDLFDMTEPADNRCERCGGTILAPARSGAPRGTCRCQRRPKVTTLGDCCLKTVEQYEQGGDDIATVAKSRGEVNLFCQGCQSCVTWRDGAWNRIL